MADKVNFSVHATPIETLTSQDTQTTTDILAGEVATSVGGSGTAAVTDYQGTSAKQGIGGSDVDPGVRNYVNAVDNSYTQISAETAATFVYIKNTGKLFSNATTLGATGGTHCVAIATVNSGTTIISSLAAGEAIVLKALPANTPIDCTKIKVKTVESNGAAAGTDDHLAVEILVVK